VFVFWPIRQGRLLAPNRHRHRRRDFKHFGGQAKGATKGPKVLDSDSSINAENYLLPEPRELSLNGSFAVFKMIKTVIKLFEKARAKMANPKRKTCKHSHKICAVNAQVGDMKRLGVYACERTHCRAARSTTQNLDRAAARSSE
jgi:hypothetical protein